MHVLLDESGEIETGPDDFFHLYAKPVSKWLSSKDQNGREDYEEFSDKCETYSKAYKLYKSVSNKEYLRDEPHVLENWDSVKAKLNRMFIFKEDNNGTTYRVVDEYLET